MCKSVLSDAVHSKWAGPMISDFSSILKKDMENLMLNGPSSELDLTENAQPAIFINSYLNFLKFQREGNENNTRFTHALGNSVGEYCALTAVGSIQPSTAVKLL